MGQGGSHLFQSSGGAEVGLDWGRGVLGASSHGISGIKAGGKVLEGWVGMGEDVGTADP